MGAESSREYGPQRRTLSSKPGKSSKSSLIAKWQKRQLSTQLFSVVRHAERADGIYAFLDGARWTATEDFRRWPLDPPLSDTGLEHAKEIGSYIGRYAEEQDTGIHVVISSPYYRCIQTAVLICNAFASGARLLVDRSLGEVYGPSVMGPAEPCSPVRGMDYLLAYCGANAVTCQTRLIGTWPTWPEDLKDARRRYALRFFSYLQRSVTTRRNFILVSHGDCVGAVLSTMPSMMQKVVDKVDYGGLFVAKRTRSDKMQKSGRKGTLNSLNSVLPTTEEEVPGDQLDVEKDFDDMAEMSMQDLKPQTRRDNWMQEPGGASMQPILATPKASDSWAVELHGISMREREGTQRFQRRLRALAAQSELSSRKIEQLLGELGDQPLGDDPAMQQQQQQVSRTMTERSGVVPSCCSFSTYLFGASEAGADRDYSTRELDLSSDLSEGAASSLLDGEPASPRDGRSRKNHTAGQARTLSSATPRLSLPGSQGHAHRAARPSFSSQPFELERAATLQGLLDRGAIEAPLSARLKKPGADDTAGSFTADFERTVSERRNTSTLLPVREQAREERKFLKSTDSSNLMQRRRTPNPASSSTASASTSPWSESVGVRLLPPMGPTEVPGAGGAALPGARTPTTPSPPDAASPPSPAGPSPATPGKLGNKAGSPEEVRKAPVVFSGLDGSALLQRRRKKQAP